MKKQSTVAVKFQRPQTTHAVLRSRLNDVLDAALATPVVWLSARAGAGKTTAVASWLAARRSRCVWYDLGEEDRDLAGFFYQLSRATTATVPVLQQGLRPSTVAFARLYFHELFTTSQLPSLLVFDNVELMRPEWQTALAEGLELIPPGFHVVLIGTCELPPEFAQLRARQRVTEVPADCLRFTAKECEQLLKINRANAAPLCDLMDGWATGLLLLGRWLQEQESTLHAVPDMDAAGLFDYFATRVFNRLDEPTKRFVRLTALLPDVTATIANELTGRNDSEHVLTSLHRQNVFIGRRRDGQWSYRYHGAFRTFLLDRSRTEDPQTLKDLRERAGHLLVKAGRLEEGTKLLLEAECHEASTALVLRQATALYEQGRTETLARWLGAIPNHDHPWLKFWRGVCLLTTERHAAHCLLEQALDAFDQAGDREGVFTAWAQLVEALLLDFANLTALDPLLARYETLLERYGSPPTPLLEVGTLTALFMARSYRDPRHPQLHETATRALVLSDRLTTLTPKLRVGSFVLLHYTYCGNALRSELAFTRLSRVDPNQCPNLDVRLSSHFSLGFYAMSVGHFSEALLRLESAIDVAIAAGTSVRMPDMLGLSVICAVWLGDPSRARGYFASLRELQTRGEPVRYSAAAFIEAYLLLDERDAPAALERAEQALADMRALGFASGMLYARALAAQARCLLGDFELALADMRLAVVQAQLDGELRLVHALTMVLAYVCLQAGLAEEAEAHLRQCLSMGRQQRYVHCGYGVHPRLMQRVFEAALTANIETDYVRQTAQRLHLRLKNDDSVDAADESPVAIRCLGSFELRINGSALARGRKQQTKPIELIKALVTLGEKEVSIDRLAFELWPESIGADAVSALAITLRRARKLCRNDGAIVRHGGKLSLDERLVWTDVRALRESFADLSVAMQNSDDKAAAAGTKRMLALYRSNLLEGEQAIWCEPARERLRDQFIRHTQRLVRYWLERGQADYALACTERLKEIGEYHESTDPRVG